MPREIRAGDIVEFIRPVWLDEACFPEGTRAYVHKALPHTLLVETGFDGSGRCHFLHVDRADITAGVPA